MGGKVNDKRGLMRQARATGIASAARVDCTDSGAPGRRFFTA